VPLDSGDAEGGPRKTLGVRRNEDNEGAPASGGPGSRKPGLRSRFRQGGLKPTAKPVARAGERGSGAAGKPGRTGEARSARATSDTPRRTAEPSPGRSSRRPDEGRSRSPAGASRERVPRRQDGNRPARDETVRRESRETGRAQRSVRPASSAPVEDDRRFSVDEASVTRVDVEGNNLAAAPEGVRLSKVMAERGLCSRREADAIIERGWVSVDGRRISELGTRIDPDAEIVLAPQAKKQQAEQATILLHKPVGYVSGQPEPGYEPAVTLIGPHNQFDKEVAQRFHASHLRGLAPAGRLDIDSTGLLVLTQNGRIARQLIGEDSKVEKEYIVRVQGKLDADGLALLNHGLELDGRKLRPAKVEWINDDQLRFVLREGRKRQIRRMCELVGLVVTGLKRTRIGNVKLSDLPLGEWRFLAADEHF